MDVELMRLQDDGNPHTPAAGEDAAPEPRCIRCRRCGHQQYDPLGIGGDHCPRCRPSLPAGKEPLYCGSREGHPSVVKWYGWCDSGNPDVRATDMHEWDLPTPVFDRLTGGDRGRWWVNYPSEEAAVDAAETAYRIAEVASYART